MVRDVVSRFRWGAEPEEIRPGFILFDTKTGEYVHGLRVLDLSHSDIPLKTMLRAVALANIFYGDHFHLDIQNGGEDVWLAIE